MKEISRLNDYFIRYLFGCIGNEDILLDFINSVMLDANLETFANVQVLNPFNLKENSSDKESILDVKAVTEKGESVIIEVQLVGNKSFVQRSLYYLTKNYSSQIRDEREYSKIKPVISINILDFMLDEKNNKVHTCYMLLEKDNHNMLTNNIQLHYLELPKCADYSKNILSFDLSTWVMFFKAGDLEDTMSTIVDKKPIMKKVVDRYEKFTADKDLMSEYEKRQVFLIGYNLSLDTAKEEGREEGIEIGIKKEKIEIARNMKSKNVDIELIAEITGLSKEEIKNL